MSAVEAMVAAAAHAAGPIDGDPGRWSDAVRRASAAQVVIAADMGRLLDALSDPECKHYVRTVTGVKEDGGRYIVEFDPPVRYTFRGKETVLTDIRTGWADQPHPRMLAEVARASIGRTCMLYQRNEKEEGDTEAPDAGYRRLVHLEPLAVGTEPKTGRPSAEVVDMAERRQERAVAPALKPPERQDGPIVGTDPTAPVDQKPSEALREMAQSPEDLSKAAAEIIKLISPLLDEDERVKFRQELGALLKHHELPPPGVWATEPWDKVCPAVKIYLRVCSQGKNPGLKAALFVAREMLGIDDETKEPY